MDFWMERDECLLKGLSFRLRRYLGKYIATDPDKENTLLSHWISGWSHSGRIKHHLIRDNQVKVPGGLIERS